MGQSRCGVAQLAGGSALLTGGVGMNVIRRRFARSHSLLFQPTTESICGHDQTPA